MLILPVLSIFALVVAQSAAIDAAAILNRYVQAIGGECADANIVVCQTRAGGRLKYQFNPRSGLLVGQETEGARPVRIIYDDYRRIDGVQLPFKTWIEVAGAVIKYNAETIRQNQAVDRRDFARPAR